jgi:transcriptional regulator with PAS, ATPase and Fis domain
VLFDMKGDLSDLKKLTLDLIKNGNSNVQEANKGLIQKIYGKSEENKTTFDEELRLEMIPSKANQIEEQYEDVDDDDDDDDDENYLFAEAIEEEEETLSLEAKEIELIKKSLERNKGKRKAAADELGISERTLYRKIKQYDL